MDMYYSQVILSIEYTFNYALTMGNGLCLFIMKEDKDRGVVFFFQIGFVPFSFDYLLRCITMKYNKRKNLHSVSKIRFVFIHFVSMFFKDG